MIAVILIAVLLAGCWPFDWIFPEPVKKITIEWSEDAIRYNIDGVIIGEPWHNDDLGPATLIQDDREGWCFADVKEFYNDPTLEYSGIVFITKTGLLSGDSTYFYKLPTEDSLVGQVEIVVYEDGTSGTMVGSYTQKTYKFGTKEEVQEKYEGIPIVLCAGSENKWFVAYTNYIVYQR